MNGKKITSALLAALTLGLLTLAACGGGDGGGGTSPVTTTATTTATATATTTPTPTPTSTALSRTDMAGFWSYNASGFSGTMRFDSSGTLLYVTISTCGYTTSNVSYYIDNSFSTYAYNIFIRAWGYCGDTAQLLKFALRSSSSKTTASGYVDQHYNGDGGTYRRWSCSMTKQ